MRGGTSLGDTAGVVYANGRTWTEVRRTSLHILRDFGLGKNAMEDIIEQEIDTMLQHIDDHWINSPLDVSEFFNIPVLSSLWKIISGESLKMGDPKLTELVTNVQNLMTEFSNPLTLISFQSIPMAKLFNNLGLVRYLSYTKKILELCYQVVNSHKDKTIDGDNPLTFVEAFLHKIGTISDESHPLNGDTGELNMVNVLLDFFIGGSDTSSTTLNWAMLYMIQNPEVQTKVRNELQSNLGSRKAKMADRHLTPYTEAVIHEIQRKGNISPMGLFHQTTETIKVGEYEIPPDTLLIPLIGEIMHDPEHFPEPSQFEPERYLTTETNGNVKFTPHPRVIPFCVGKRKCLGEPLARMTLYKFFTTILQKYEIVSGQDAPILDDRNDSFVCGPKSYKLKFLKV